MTPYLIAITGGSGSGKSTLASAFQKLCGEDRCALVGEDNYYKARGDHARKVLGLPPKEVEKIINFDDCASKDMDDMLSDIAALRRGEIIRQPVYDFPTHDRVTGQHIEVEPKPVIIVEGIHVLSSPENANLFDLTVYVDTPSDLRLARRILRDTAPQDKGGRGRDLEGVVSQYMRFVRGSHQRFTEPAKYYCDLVIADEGLPAAGTSAPAPEAISRMLAPLVNYVRTARPDLLPDGKN